MDLTTAIEAFNRSSSPQISFFTARDGGCIAHLPRGRGQGPFLGRYNTSESPFPFPERPTPIGPRQSTH
jgi:hypothetical protein